MPPLLLDEDEAIAIAVGLRTAARASVTGIEETAIRALVKLEQVLPAHLRRRVAALGSATVAPPPGGPTVDPQHADHDRRRLPRLRVPALRTTRSRDGTASRREVEPHALVNRGRRWYLVAWDRRREDWRTFRVDRLERAGRDRPALHAARAAGDGRGRLRRAEHRRRLQPLRGARHRPRLGGGDRGAGCRTWAARSPRSTRSAASTAPPTTTSNGSRSASPCSASRSTCTSRRSCARTCGGWRGGSSGR